MPYLKHKKSGEIYPYTEALAERGDMDEIDALTEDVPPVVVRKAEPAAMTQEQLDDIGELVSGIT